MPTDDADDLVPFLDVTIIKATAPTLLCLIQGRSVWLPRMHVSGKLWRAGDRGKLFVRRWVARDRQLIDPHQSTTEAPAPSFGKPFLAASLHLVGGGDAPHAK